MKRRLEIVILSDIHLGTFGCHAKELLDYLKSIAPETLILNGDIFDMWHFKKSYFPKEHIEVVRKILKMAASGTKVYYLTGNHDDMLRRFGEVELGVVQLRNKLVFQIHGKTHWVFHGDVFDASIQKSRWLAKLGGEGYDLLIRLNRMTNHLRAMLGWQPVSFSAKIKKKVKGAVKLISDFEQTAIELAAEKGYDYVICGHIHQPQIREIQTPSGHKITYMNSGDWIEHLTALEHNGQKWSLYTHDPIENQLVNPKLEVSKKEPKTFRINKEEMMPEPVGMAAFQIS